MNIITFSGWGSPADSLNAIVPKMPQLQNWSWGFFEQASSHQFTVSEDTHLVAYSMGSLKALEFAATYSNKVKSLTLISGFSQFTYSPRPKVEMLQQKKLTRMIDAFQLNQEAVYDQFHLNSSFPCEPSSSTNFSNAKQTALKDGLDLLQTESSNKYLSDITCPVFLLRGDKDKIVSSEHNHYLASQLKNCTVLNIEKHGHALPFTAPKVVQQEITRFIEENS